MTKRLFVCLALACLALAACGVATAHQGTTAQQSPTAVASVRVVRTQTMSRQNWTPLDKTIHDATQAQRLYDATLALPLFPNDAINCPADFGLGYNLTFTRNDGSQITVATDPYGCWQVSIEGQKLRRANDAYWNLLAQTLGITRAQLQPINLYPIGPA